MSDFLIEASQMFDNKVALAQADFMEAIATYLESCIDDEFTVTEKKNDTDTFLIKTKKFFANLVAAFQNFIATVQVELDKKTRSAEFQNKLRKLHTELKEGEKGGITTVEVHDVWAMKDKYEECVDELKTYAKKFSEMKYKRTSDIDDDIAKFNKILEEYKQELQSASEKMVTVSIKKMINFIEDEVSGRSRIMNSLNDAISLLQQMSKDCELIEKRRDILGPDIIPRHVGFIKRIAISISGFLKQWAVKIITTVVFIVG